jgi:hypothetical protein
MVLEYYVLQTAGTQPVRSIAAAKVKSFNLSILGCNRLYKKKLYFNKKAS